MFPLEDRTVDMLTDILSSTESGSGIQDESQVSLHDDFSNVTGFNDVSSIAKTAFGFTDMCFDRWLPSNNILFQLANAFLFLSYMAPPGIHGLLYLRACLMIGSLFFTLWGYIVICAFDTFVWNAVFTLINFVHLGIIAYILRPIRFSHEIEHVYASLFKPLRVTRHQFKVALDCMKEIQTLMPQDHYCIEKLTRVDRLSLVLSGRLMVSQGDQALHVIDSHHFIDSPEWFGVSSDDFYQMTITAIEDSRVIVWNRDKLRLTISGDPFLQAVFDNILGKDVVKKLLLVTGVSCNGNAVPEGDTQLETSKLLPPREGKHAGTGRMDLLLSAQIDCNSPSSHVWNLTNIVEDPRDTETTV